MAQERLILDPSETTEGRTELDITPWIVVEGIDWGDAEMEAYKAEAQVGESVVDFRIPNRQIAAPLVIRDQGGTSFATARSYIQAKAALWQREGGVGKRVLGTGGTVYFDVVANGLTLSGDWMQANKSIDTEAELRLEAIPDFYEPEVEVASAEEKAAAELIKVIPDPGGDMPARVRIVVEEKQGVDQKGLIWAFRSRHYSSASTANTAYEAEELQTLDTARKVALSGASGGTVVQHGTISTNWTPVVGGRLGGTSFPTHTGTNRVFARVYSTSGTLAQARLVWDVGDLVNPAENPAYALPGGSAFHIADLGEVRLDKAPVGNHRWDWQIQAKGDEGNEDFKVDKVWIVNSDEGMGVLTAPLTLPSGLSTYSARDEFTSTAGTLNGKTLPTGGTWTTSGGTVDFVAAEGVITRVAKSDSFTRNAEPPGGEYPNGAMRVDFEWSALPTEAGKSLETQLDIVNTCTCLAYYHCFESGLIWSRLYLGAGLVYIDYPWQPKVRYSILMLSVGGRYGAAWVTTGGAEPNGPPDIVAPITGASGKARLGDRYTGTESITRTYDNYAVWVPSPDAVAFASKSAQLTTDGMYRHDSGGSAYGPVSRVVGDLPRLPAGGLESRTTELFLKGSRGDLGGLPDSAIDDLAVKVFASRGWLTVPGSI